MTGFTSSLRLALRSLREADDPRLPAAVAGRPVLLIHGFAATSRVMLPLERALRRALGRPVIRMGLGARFPLHLRDVRASARHVQQELEKLAREHGFDRVDVVGHSMGGLVATYLLKCLDRGQRIRRVVTLGTPHRGTLLAAAGVLCFGAVSRGVWQMLPGSPLLRELAGLPVPEECELIAIGSAGDRVVPAARALLRGAEGERNRIVERLSHWELTASSAALQVVKHVLGSPAA